MAPFHLHAAATCVVLFAATAFAGTTPSVLVWQPDHTASASGQALYADLLVLGEDAALTDELFALSSDLFDHQIVIAVVGFTPDTHILDATEGLALEMYVQGGGLLLLEGGDCFDYDPDVAGGYDVRPIFGLAPGSDGNHFSGDVIGDGELGGSGFFFDYRGESSFLDELNPVTSSAILRKATRDDVLGVFHAAYGEGRAIGVSCEYAGLVEPASAGSRSGTAAPVLTQRQELLAALLDLLRGQGDPPTDVGRNATSLVLHAATPNPLTERTMISYELTHETRVKVRIFDVSGRLVRVLRDAPAARGAHFIPWDGRDTIGNRAASGVYFLALEAGGTALKRRILVLK